MIKKLHRAEGSVVWSNLIILLLVAGIVSVSSLYVRERVKTHSNAVSVAGDAAQDQQHYEWKMVTSWPKNFPGLGLGPENFAKRVEAMSNGRLKIHVHGAGEIVPALGVFDAVSSGSVEMGHTAGYYHIGKIPAAAFYTAIPFGMNVNEVNAWIHYGGGLELWREIYEPFNVIPFAGGNTGMQMGGWFNKPIRSIDDIQGLKMRIPGIAGEVYTRAGGSAVTIAGGELYTSMQTGVIDATEWVGPYNDRSFGLHEVATYYYYPGWHETSAMLEFEVNKTAWDSLPADLQAIVETAARAVNYDMADEYTTRNAIALEELAEIGIVPEKFPDEVLTELAKVADQYYAELTESDEDFARIFKSYTEFKDRTYEWLKVSERAIFEYRAELESVE